MQRGDMIDITVLRGRETRPSQLSIISKLEKSRANRKIFGCFVAANHASEFSFRIASSGRPLGVRRSHGRTANRELAYENVYPKHSSVQRFEGLNSRDTWKLQHFDFARITDERFFLSEFTRCSRRDRVMVVELFLPRERGGSSPFTLVDRLSHRH